MCYMNRIFVVAVLAFSLTLCAAASAEETHEKKPGTVHKILRKIRHPFKKVNVDTEKQKADAAQVETTKEQSAVLMEAPLGPTEPPKRNDAQTSAAVNDIPGVHTTPATFAEPQIDTSPIPWYAPIKKITRPIENISKVSVALGQQIMRLEGPIASLQPSMLKLRNEMTKVQGKMGTMQGSLTSMEGSMHGVNGSMKGVRTDIGQVRGDLGGMQRDIVRLEGPVSRLEAPINRVVSPVTSVQNQLSGVQKELADLRALLATVLFSIYVAAAAICFGTPFAAFVVYKNRHKLFPHTHEHDMPTVKPADSE